MVLWTFIYAVAMVALGVFMYWLAGSGLIEGTKASWTALIPAFAALPFFAFAFVGMLLPATRKHVMHAAAAFSLLLAAGGLFMSISGLVRAGFDVGQLPRPLATLATGLMGVISLLFLLLCIQSFIRARRVRAAVA